MIETLPERYLDFFIVAIWTLNISKADIEDVKSQEQLEELKIKVQSVKDDDIKSMC